jgi:protein-disulfide isomerase
MRVRLAALAGLVAICGAGASRSDIVEGNPASPVRVTIYEDLACSDCAKFRAVMDEKIMPKYGRRVVFIHRDFPLGRHDWARMAALAGRWVYEQSSTLGIRYRRELMAEQDHVSVAGFKDWLRLFAERYKLDQNAIVASLDDQRLGALVDSDIQGGVARGVVKVPAVYLGTQVFVENILFEDLARALDEALEK